MNMMMMMIIKSNRFTAWLGRDVNDKYR